MTAIGVVATIAAIGFWYVNVGITEFYSDGWTAKSSGHAEQMGIRVATPVIVPARLAVSDSIDLYVTDAWVERPWRVRYRWFILRRTVPDSSRYRLVLHHVQVPHDTSRWTAGNGQCFVPFELLIDGKQGGQSRGGVVDIATKLSRVPFTDTIRLSVRRPNRDTTYRSKMPADMRAKLPPVCPG